MGIVLIIKGFDFRHARTNGAYANSGKVEGSAKKSYTEISRYPNMRIRYELVNREHKYRI